MLDRLFATFVSGIVLYAGWHVAKALHPHVSRWWEECLEEMDEEKAKTNT